MTRQEKDDKYVCYDCIGDHILAGEAKDKGRTVECSYCKHTHESFDLDTLADRIHEVIQGHFERTPDEPNWLDSIMIREGVLDVWIPDGERVVDVITDIAHLPEEVAKDIAELLDGRFHYWAVTEGGEDPYNDEAYYEERRPDDFGFHYSWRAFCNEIMYTERIFPENAEPVLEEIFGDPGALSTYDGTPVVLEVDPDGDFSVWRARTAQSKGELIAILEKPAQQLGPPPHSLAKAGRMNQKGIPVFYGALEDTTCVAEVHPPVGSQVVLGEFKPSRKLRLLDLGALSKVYVNVNVSHFDPDYSVLHGRASFIRSLVNEISRPIMPQDADREYLPTQFVASYLARKVTPNFDGVIFPSSQTQEDGNNVVLFNYARGVEEHDLPEGTTQNVILPASLFGDTGDEYGDILVFETVPSGPPDAAPQVSPDGRQRGPIRLFQDDEPDGPETHVKPTLQLAVGSIEVRKIKGAEYREDTYSVSRHQETEKERAEFEQRHGISDYFPDDILPEELE